MNSHENRSVGRFFDELSQDYTDVIERCFPRYREMLWAILDYLPDRSFHSILELGCGTGNLTVLLRDVFPEAKIQVVDLSSDSLQVCRSRLPGNNLVCHEQDFRDLGFEEEEFDLVVSSIAIHHLDSAGKQELLGNIYRWLTDDGVHCFADQFAGATPDIYTRHMENWKTVSSNAGSTEEEWQMWMRHQQECDHHEPLDKHVQWHAEAGFPTVDCVWRYLLWAVVQARKQDWQN